MAVLRPLISHRRKKKLIGNFVAPMLFLGLRNCLQTEVNTNNIKTLCKQGRLREAIRLLDHSLHHSSSSSYVDVLLVCIEKKTLTEGKLIHAHLNQTGFISERLLQHTLVNMYSKCRRLMDARRVFDEMPNRMVTSWTVMIAAYTRHGIPEEALTLFHQMQSTGFEPDKYTFSSVLPACTKLEALEEGMKIHEGIVRGGFLSEIVVGNALVDMYAKCGSLEKARDLFDKMRKRDVVSWTTMITGYAQHGWGEEALKLFQKMKTVGVKPNLKTFASILPVCANLAALEQGVDIHEEIIKSGLQCDVFVESSLVDMYAKCGNIEKARQIFDAMDRQDAPAWTAMISVYARDGQGEEALKLFQQMQQVGVKASSRTYASVLSACANLVALKQGAEIHEKIITSGFHSDVIALSSLIDMYAKCGSMQKARELFDKMHHRDVVSWTTIVTGYLQNGYVDEALKLFQAMPQRDVFSWTAMIAGYAQNGRAEDALNLFQQMNLAGVRPNSRTFASILPVCANLAALEHGMEIHEDIIRSGLECDLIVENALIDMYAKCGMLDKAYKLFDRMHQRDVVSWTTMIAGYAIHSYGKEALELFEQMKYSGISPDHVTLVCVLSACCHAGLVEEGYHYFNSLREDYHITPTMDHYRCMVDLLCRAGRLDEAQTFIIKMPIKPDVEILISLLGACKIHNKIELAESAAEHIFELDPENAAPYVLLSNMYATAGRWEDSEKVRKMMKDRGVKKTPGCSWIEINKQLHTFLVEDRSLTTQEIDAMS